LYWLSALAIVCSAPIVVRSFAMIGEGFASAENPATGHQDKIFWNVQFV
jgi:hypothetical protein